MKHRVLSGTPHTRTTLSIEDGKRYRGLHHNTDHLERHVRKVRDMHSYATRSSNPNQWQHIGTVPIAMIVDWCRKNGYSTWHWATNKDGAKDKFMKWFLSRDHSKLHNQHVTTKRERSTVTVPTALSRQAVDLTGIGK